MNRRKAIRQTAIILGGAVSASVIAGVMSGCQPKGEPDWTPQFLTPTQAKTIEAISEYILPETDTPGAKSLHLTEFIDLMVKDTYSGYDQLQFHKGLAKFQEECKFFTGTPFLNASSVDQQKFLVLHEQKAVSLQKQTGAKPFIFNIKELLLVGYFTSEYAITELMNYNPLPTKFEGCVDAPSATKIQIGIEGRSA